jgi:hypothetical protein
LGDLVVRLEEEGGREEGEEGEEGWKDLSTLAAAGKTKKRRSFSPLFGSLSLSPSSASAATAAAVAAAAAAALTPAAARALLEGVVQHCLLPTVAERPTFAALHARLSSLVVSGGGR